MRVIKWLLFILIILQVSACKNAPAKTNSKEDPASTNQEPASFEMVKDYLTDLTDYGITYNPSNILGGLKVGEAAPDFTMLSQDGKEHNLKSMLSDGPVLLVFLRAEWCSYCVKHLQAFQENIENIQNSGKVQVIAVSPQRPSYMKPFHEENNFSYPILYDEDHSVMKDYKVFFHVTEKYNNYIERVKGKRIEIFNGDEDPVMPVPATYYIGKDGVINYVHYDPDYRKRSDLKEIMSKL